MAEVDISSYRQPAQKGPLDVLQQVQTVQQQKLSIDKATLDQINQGYEYLLRELNSLPENAGADDMRRVAQNAVKMRLIKPDMAANFIGTIPSDPTRMRAFRDEVMGRLMSTQEAVNFQYGQRGSSATGQTVTPTVDTPRFRTAGPQAAGPPIQQQEPPTADTTDINPTLPDGRPNPNYGATRRVGPQAPRLPVGTVPAGTLPGQYQPIQPNPVQTTPVPGPAPGVRPRLPVAPSAPLPPGAGSGATVDQRFPQAAGSPTSLPAGEASVIESEAKQLQADRDNATGKLNAILPMKNALRLIPQTMTGIGAETFNNIRAGLIQMGAIDPSEEDQTVVWQELNKALARYIQQSPVANRSDAAQALGASASPNAAKQLNPALIKIARDAVAYDRIEAARASAWDGPASGRGYGKFRADFAKNLDHRAFSIDLLPANDRIKLIKEIYADLNGKDADKKRAAQKFFDSLKIAEKTLDIQP